MADKMKYYAVKVGRARGIYASKAEALAQVEGLEKWEMRSFDSMQGARDYILDGGALPAEASPAGYALYKASKSLNKKKPYCAAWAKRGAGIYMSSREVSILQEQKGVQAMRFATVKEAEEQMAAWDKQKGTDSRIIKEENDGSHKANKNKNIGQKLTPAGFPFYESEKNKNPEKPYCAVSCKSAPGIYMDRADVQKLRAKEGIYARRFATVKEADDFLQKYVSPEEVAKTVPDEDKRESGKTPDSEKNNSGKEKKNKKQKPSDAKPVGVDADNKNGAFAYSDGSYKDGVCAWGVAFSFGGESMELSGSFTEPPEQNLCCVAGELRAAREAIRLALSSGAKELDLYYDFVGVQRYIEECPPSRLNGLAREYRGYVDCAKESMKINFYKVKAHSGNSGNNRADRLAKRALKRHNSH